MILGSNKQPTVPDSAVSHFLYVSPRWKMQHFPAGCSFEICLVPSNKQGDQGICEGHRKKQQDLLLGSCHIDVSQTSACKQKN